MVTGCPSPGAPRDRSTDDVTPEQNENSDNLLTQEVNATNEMTILSPQQSITTTTGSLSLQSRNTTRNKWTKDQRLELFRCYVIAINLKKPAPATKGTFEVWKERNPHIHTKMTSTTLNTARRYAEKNCLCEMELDIIRKEEGAPNANETQSIEPAIIPTPISNAIVAADIGNDIIEEKRNC